MFKCSSIEDWSSFLLSHKTVCWCGMANCCFMSILQLNLIDMQFCTSIKGGKMPGLLKHVI